MNTNTDNILVTIELLGLSPAKAMKKIEKEIKAVDKSPTANRCCLFSIEYSAEDTILQAEIAIHARDHESLNAAATALANAIVAKYPQADIVYSKNHHANNYILAMLREEEYNFTMAEQEKLLQKK